MSNNSFEQQGSSRIPEPVYRVDSMVYRRLEEGYGRDVSALDNDKLLAYEAEIRACENDIQIRRSELDRGVGRPNETYSALNKVAEDLERLHASPVRAEMQKRNLSSSVAG